MSVYKIILVVLLALQLRYTSAQSVDSVTQPNRTRLYALAGTSAAVMAGTYYYLQTVWWKENQTQFKFDKDMDYRYAKNLDKAGHFLGGEVTAQLFKMGYKWAGVNQSKALLYAGITGTAIQAIIEVKDAYAPTYGFSIGDLAAGSAGSFFPYLQHKVPAFNAVHFKVSYFRHHNYYYEQFRYAQLIDDYMNQTYWVSVAVNDWLPKASKAEKLWPDFLTLTFGWGVDETLNWYYKGVNIEQNKGKGNFEYYASIDVDWRKIIKQNTTFKRALTYSLNLVKLPLPAVRFAPTFKGYTWFL